QPRGELHQRRGATGDQDREVGGAAGQGPEVRLQGGDAPPPGEPRIPQGERDGARRQAAGEEAVEVQPPTLVAGERDEVPVRRRGPGGHPAQAGRVEVEQLGHLAPPQEDKRTYVRRWEPAVPVGIERERRISTAAAS